MRARHQIASAVSCTLETLETRRLFAASLVSGVLTVTGGAGSDVINISIGGTHYSVGQNNDPAQSFAVGSVDSIVLNLGDGSNWTFLHHALDPDHLRRRHRPGRGQLLGPKYDRADVRHHALQRHAQRLGRAAHLPVDRLLSGDRRIGRRHLQRPAAHRRHQRCHLRLAGRRHL
jgi:hypothetical protein